MPTSPAAVMMSQYSVSDYRIFVLYIIHVHIVLLYNIDDHWQLP